MKRVFDFDGCWLDLDFIRAINQPEITINSTDYSVSAQFEYMTDNDARVIFSFDMGKCDMKEHTYTKTTKKWNWKKLRFEQSSEEKTYNMEIVNKNHYIGSEKHNEFQALFNEFIHDWKKYKDEGQ